MMKAKPPYIGASWNSSKPSYGRLEGKLCHHRQKRTNRHDSHRRRRWKPSNPGTTAELWRCCYSLVHTGSNRAIPSLRDLQRMTQEIQSPEAAAIVCLGVAESEIPHVHVLNENLGGFVQPEGFPPDALGSAQELLFGPARGPNASFAFAGFACLAHGVREHHDADLHDFPVARTRDFFDDGIVLALVEALDVGIGLQELVRVFRAPWKLVFVAVVFGGVLKISERTFVEKTFAAERMGYVVVVAVAIYLCGVGVSTSGKKWMRSDANQSNCHIHERPKGGNNRCHGCCSCLFVVGFQKLEANKRKSRVEQYDTIKPSPSVQISYGGFLCASHPHLDSGQAYCTFQLSSTISIFH